MLEGKSNLYQRVVFGVPLAAIALGATWAGGLWFTALVLIIGFFTLNEWLVITGDKKDGNSWLTPVLLVFFLGVAFVSILFQLGFAITPLQAVVALAVGVFVGTLFRKGPGTHATWPALGVLYVGLAMIGLITTRGTSTLGLITIFYLFLIVWGTDVMAYFTGRAFGGPKLAPKISPGKTWSGAIGGAIAATILGGLTLSLTDVTGFLPAALGGFVLSVISQLGDLFESWLKRRNGVKDASNLIPGHGGMFDRVDGLLPVAIVAHFLHMAVAA